MSYAAQPPPVAVPPVARRPVAVSTAVALLWAMAVAGLTYAAGMAAVTPGVVGRLRDAAPGSDTVDNFVTVLWLVAALALVLGVLFVAFFAVLGIALRKGSRLARGIALGVCVFGVLTGCGTLAILAAQRAGEAEPGTLSAALNAAYPSGWIVLNVAVAAAQVVAYLVVGALLLAAPRGFFGGTAEPAAALPGFVPPGQLVAQPPEWASPQTKSFVTGGSEPDQFSDQPTPPKSAASPEHEYWSRPNE
ncbi:hypothetical protein QLQ12_30085 [Actinoplanes sp. NEAU-A12]|uniref:DUF2567 domain-containing protein n=1 Tax=Actinoplanes sandaracinus TaxID=3045177 RepID=A0ABT6WTA5_9ACTN|nr:hypothetical protein [Actinoplanes sandaracinus]MDI6102876.1 hypothetical protein [Actinoplanes sandaracinus]